jgi:hypothetical protein
MVVIKNRLIGLLSLLTLFPSTAGQIEDVMKQFNSAVIALSFGRNLGEAFRNFRDDKIAVDFGEERRAKMKLG